MNRYFVRIMVASLSLTLGVAGDEKLNKEAQHLQGTWKLVKFDTPPERKPPEDIVAKMGLIFAANKLITRDGDHLGDESTYAIDPSKSPRWFDTVATAGPNKGKTAKGIYELNGDELRICIGPPGQKRPFEFKVTDEPNNQTGIMYLKRVK
jgi:uncharacterized protein (TIGR03067 family)